MVQATKKMTDFIVEKKLGEGSFSEVYKVKRKSDGAIYAMKKVKMGKLSAKEKENALNEVRILASVNHPNVIGYKEAFFEDITNCLCLVMENADGGDLLMKIDKHKKVGTDFTEKEVWHYFIQIIRGLKALHDLSICHRDIKSANVFVTKDGVIKLGDLNVSRVQKGGMMRTQTGTPYYACPEVWKDQPYDNGSDIWSAGCVLYEMIMKMPPFRAQTMKGLYAKVLSGRFDPIPAHYSLDMRNVLKSCLQVRSSQRPKCDKILNMPGLLNHITGTLDEIQALVPDDQEKLMKTIRMPRRMVEITKKMPAPQYDQSRNIKRTNSQPQINQMNIDAIIDSGKNVLNQIQLSANKAAARRGQAVLAGNDSSQNLSSNQQMSTLSMKDGSVVQVESTSLIQKAHELQNIKTSNKRGANNDDGVSYRTPKKQQSQKLPISLADRAARLNHELNDDLPAIEEALDRENDTFAQGGPISCLQKSLRRRKDSRQSRVQSSQAQRHRNLNSQDRSNLNSARQSSQLAVQENEQIGQNRNYKNQQRNGNNYRQQRPYEPQVVSTDPNTPRKVVEIQTNQRELISHMGEKQVSLPRINSSQSAQRLRPYQQMRRELSSENMLESQVAIPQIQPASNNIIISPHPNRRNRKLVQPLSEQRQQNHNIAVDNSALRRNPSRDIKRSIGSRPRSNISDQSNEQQQLNDQNEHENHLYSGSRANQSALKHIRRIRRNLASQQASERLLSRELSQEQINGTGNNQIDNFRRIRQEEAVARAQLMQPGQPIAPLQPQVGYSPSRNSRNSELKVISSERRLPNSQSNRKMMRHVPSENVLPNYQHQKRQYYEPINHSNAPTLQNHYSQKQIPKFIQPAGHTRNNSHVGIGLISSNDQHIRQII